MHILHSIVVILIFIFSASAQNYFWPTNASKYLTSSFCEYRPGHYHSAIDIKTWNREGYPVYAVEDGKIYRIRVSPFGYGKVIYLKLNDGNFAVYGHLQKFTSKIDDIVRKKQIENQKYRLNWYPQNMNVKKGEIIGYTGSTGTGSPHLHFEIRNQKEQPLNPLAFYSDFTDNIRPKLQKIAIIPLNVNSIINNSFLPQVFNLKYIKDGVYVIPSPLRVRGKVGLTIKGYDNADGVYNRLGFYQTRMNVNGEEVYQITYDKMDFSTTGYINTEIYYPLKKKLDEVFHKLYKEPFNILPFYRSFNGSDGSIKVLDKPVTFTISVKDFSGNTSLVKGELVPEPVEKIEINKKFINDGWVFLKFTVFSYNFLSFSSSSDLSNWRPISYFDFLERNFENSKHTLFIKLKIPESKHHFLKIETKSLNGKTIQRLVNFANIDSLQTPQIFLADKKLVIETDHIGDKFIAQTGSTMFELPSLYDSNGMSQISVPIQYFVHPDLKLGVQEGDSTLWFKEHCIKLFEPKATQSSAWYDSSIVINTFPNSFFDSTLVMVNVHESDSIEIDLPAKNKIFEILPDDIALLSRVSIFIKSDSIKDSQQWGIYQKNGKQKYSFVSANYDATQKGFLFRSSSLGSYIIAQDTLPPVLQIQSPDSSKRYKSNPKILFTTFDDHSGINHENNISISVDGKFVLPEWDPEQKIVHAIIDSDLAAGDHQLLIEIKDQCRNISRKTIPFIIE